MAINRKAIVQGAFFGQATPILGGVVPEWNWGYADIDFFKPEGDPEQARKLLAEAGHPDGFETSMTIASSFPPMVAMAPIIQANLQAVGIKTKIGTMEIPRYWDEVWSTSNFDITAMYWLSPAGRSRRLRVQQLQMRHGHQRAEILQQGHGRHPREGEDGAHPGRAQGLYKQMQQLSLDDMGQVPLVNGWLLIAHTKKLQGYVPMRTGFLKTLKDAWLEA